MPQPEYSLLTRTDLEMTAVDGVVDSLESWIDRFRDQSQSCCEVEHVLLRWDGAALAPQAQARASGHGRAMLFRCSN